MMVVGVLNDDERLIDSRGRTPQRRLTCGSGLGDAGWGWVDGAWWTGQSAMITFAAGGAHTLRMRLREDGVKCDQIVMSPSRYLVAPPGAPENDGTLVRRP